MCVCVFVYLDKHSGMSEGVVEHHQHVGRRNDAGVVTPGGDQQPVIKLKKETKKGVNTTESVQVAQPRCTTSRVRV